MFGKIVSLNNNRKEPGGGAMRSQKEPWTARSSQERSIGVGRSQGARRSQEELDGTKSSQEEEPGGARTSQKEPGAVMRSSQE